jgi:hypothetical protein
MMNPAGSIVSDVVFDEIVRTFTGSNQAADTITYKYKGNIVAIVTQTVANSYQVTHEVRTR